MVEVTKVSKDKSKSDKDGGDGKVKRAKYSSLKYLDRRAYTHVFYPTDPVQCKAASAMNKPGPSPRTPQSKLRQAGTKSTPLVLTSSDSLSFEAQIWREKLEF